MMNTGFRIHSVFYFNFLESLLHHYLETYKSVNFIQIGANDGKRFDPIYEFVKYNGTRVKGYVVEPVKDYYEDLCANYKNHPNIMPLNVAIHNTLQETSIYKVGKAFESMVPEFALGIASFDKNHHKKTHIPSEYIIEEKVKCMSLEIMIETYQIKQLDVLILDAEGYDYEILMQIDYKKVTPAIIHFEHGLKTGTMTKNQFDELKVVLQSNNYQLFVDTGDVTAYKLDIFFNTASVENS
ncbi:MAG: FkbM family methyltransferase [Gelidibacter sp.]